MAMRYLYTTLILFAFWLVLSGKFDPFHLILGALSSLLVARMSADLLFFEPDKKGRLGEALRFLAYIPWLVVEIFKSTIHVAWLALHPTMRERIDPRIVTFRTRLKSDVARAALANSITLTPGTITVRVEEDVFTVHALSDKTAAGLPGAMEERIARIFREEAA
ncbi:MAG: Na+/H+ antiporter subunit E [Desulfurivibrionaceae bacterium]|nr:Na+/H+ antiporter subunit E [Desulfurivibrionaceae bacterium]